MSKTIVTLIGFLPNPRMMNRIHLEQQLGNLHVICWDKGKNMLKMPKEDGYTLHVIRVEAESMGTNPLGRLLPYRKFTRQAAKLIQEIQPDMIAVQGLDMLKIAAAYKKRAGKKVSIVYEVADLQRLIADEQHGFVRKAARNYLIREDRRLAGVYDKLLVTSRAFYETYFSKFIEPGRVFYMPNVPDLRAFAGFRRKTEGPFTVGFIGSIRYKEQMRNLVEAAKQSGVRTLIAGFEDGKPEIEELCRGIPNIEWVGRFDYAKEVAGLYEKCDVIYSVYNADMTNVRVALPNKLYESVYCGLPVIVAKGTYLEKMALDWGVGVGVDHHSVSELVQTIQELRDNRDLYRRIEENCAKHKEEVDLAHFNQLLKAELVRLL